MCYISLLLEIDAFAGMMHVLAWPNYAESTDVFSCKLKNG